MPTAGSRLAGEREYAFKHVLIRDVAYSTLPKAVRARKHAEVGEFISERAADRSEGVIAMVAEHYSRAATLGAAADLEPGELEAIQARALEALEAAGDASAALYSNSEAQGHYEAALVARATRSTGRPGRADRREARRRRAAARPGRPRGPRLGAVHGVPPRRGGPRPGRRPAPQDRRRRSGTRATARARSSTTSAASTCSRTARPCLELVRLYEEAASLYMHTGDNMLAIYASEKALRLAERLGEAAAASRAHGIFGRVFGRIGDSERARENLERSVELARETDPAEAVRALLALGYHLEVSEADYEARRDGVRGRRSTIALRDRRPALAGRAARGARPGRRLPRRLGGGRARRPTPRRRSPSARG